MQLVRYSPWRDLTQLEGDMEKIFGEDWDWASTSVTQGPATIDMYTEEDKLVVEVVLTGFTKEEIKVAVTGNILDIAAEHVDKNEQEAEREYLLHESSHDYRRHISLPQGIDVDMAVADFNNGRLTVDIPIEKQIIAKEVAIK